MRLLIAKLAATSVRSVSFALNNDDDIAELATDLDSCVRLLRESEYDLVVLMVSEGRTRARDAIAHIRAEVGRVPMVVMTEPGGGNDTVTAVASHGTFDAPETTRARDRSTPVVPHVMVEPGDGRSVRHPAFRDSEFRDAGFREPGSREVGSRDVGSRDSGVRDSGFRDSGFRDPYSRDPDFRESGHDLGSVDRGGPDRGYADAVPRNGQDRTVPWRWVTHGPAEATPRRRVPATGIRQGASPLGSLRGAITFSGTWDGLRVDGSAVPLSQAELRIFTAIWHARGISVTSEELLDAIYGDQERPASRVLPVFLFKLRRKLAAVGVGDAIETEIGRGVRLRADAVPDEEDSHPGTDADAAVAADDINPDPARSDRS